MLMQDAYITDDSRSRVDPPAVLIVEDERVARRALSTLLASCGYNTEAVGSAEEALNLLKERTGSIPRVALIDLNLPGMSGIELIRRLDELEPSVYPVLVTAAADDVLRTALEARPVTYLRKPLDFKQLLSVIGRGQMLH